MGHHSVKAAVFSSDRRDLLDLIEVPVLPDRQHLDEQADVDHVADVVKRVLKPWTTRSRTDCQLAVAVQGEGTQGLIVQLPSLSKKQIGVAIEVATMRFLPYPTCEASVGTVKISSTAGADGRGTSWFIAAVRKEALEFLNECVQAADLAISTAEINLLPLTRAFTANHPTDPSVLHGLICMGSRLSTLVAIRDGRPLAVRCLPIGGADLTYGHHMGLQTTWREAENVKLASDATAREVAVEPPFRRWLDQVRRSIEAWSQDGGPGNLQKIMLTGGGAAWRGIAPRLAEHVSLPVEVDHWNRLQPPTERKYAFAGTFATAVGLCLPDLFT